jgi:hypothetical protein
VLDKHKITYFVNRHSDAVHAQLILGLRFSNHSKLFLNISGRSHENLHLSTLGQVSELTTFLQEHIEEILSLLHNEVFSLAL